ncbi:MAG: right-handed parallel beta-helix repeat-containing protein [Trueperaceae bacterium]|nr:right-handed parallel beta-helix repeat-containing protein [Trueperaceae bacterium]
MKASRLSLVTLLCALVGLAAAQPEINSTFALAQAITTGGSYRVAAGSYFIHRSLVVANDLELIGAGAGETVLMVTNEALGLRIDGAEVRLQDLSLGFAAQRPGDLIHLGGGNLELVGVLLNGTRTDDDPSGFKRFGLGSGVHAWGDARVTARDSVFRGHGLAVFELSGQAVVSLENSTLESNSVGLYAEQQSSVAVAGSRFDLNRSGALILVDDAVAEIRGSDFTANGAADENSGEEADGFRFGGRSRALLEQNRIVDHPRFAISMWDEARLEMRGNHLEGNGGEYQVLDVYAAAVLLEDDAVLTMDGDVLVRNPGGALELADNAAAVLEGVRLENNGSWAHLYAAGDSELTLLSTTVVDNEGNLFIGSRARLRVEESEIRGSGFDAVILADEATGYFENNVFRANDTIALALTDAATATLVDNLFEANGSGAVMWDQSRALLEANRFLGHQRTGFAFFDESGGEARGNLVHGNLWNGVLVGDSASALLVDNDLVGNVNVGIGFSEQAVGRASGNRIAGSEVGILITESAGPELFDNVFEDNVEDVARRP